MPKRVCVNSPQVKNCSYPLSVHLLPLEGDGSPSWSVSLNMCRQAVTNGIKTIIATPHILNGVYDNKPQDIEEKVKILNQKIKENNIPLQILPRSEVHICADIIEAIKKKEILTLNKSNYILLEFPYTQIPLRIEEILFQIQIMGITPIIFHVERNLKFQQKPALLSWLIQKGALAQITATSLCGFFGPIPKKISQKFLSEELIYSIASDAHSDSEKGRGSFFPPSTNRSLQNHRPPISPKPGPIQFPKNNLESINTAPFVRQASRLSTSEIKEDFSLLNFDNYSKLNYNKFGSNLHLGLSTYNM